MADHSSSGNQVLHDQLEKAKETLGRLRCINGFTSTSSVTSQTGQGCRRHTHDVTVGKCSERNGKCSRDFSSKTWEEDEVNSGFSRAADLKCLHKQIDCLEDSVRTPIRRYVENMEQQNVEMTDAIETIRRQLLQHERVCPAMNISSESLRNGSSSFRNGSGGLRNGSDGFVSNAERETFDLKEKLYAGEKAERESRISAERLQKEVEVYREKLERSESRVKELFRNISHMQPNMTPSTSSEVLLGNQLRQQQQLTEGYFKDSTSKDRELSFLTIEKYNLESEVNSLVTDLDTSNRKRDQLSQEKKELGSSLVQCRQNVVHLEQQLRESKLEIQRLRSQFHEALDEERVRDEKISENQNFQENQIKGLRKKCKKYEEYRSSQDGVAKQLEAERDEVLARARNLSNEYKIKVSECKNLREENERLSKDVSAVQMEASLSKTEYSNSKACIERLKWELQETKSALKVLQVSLQDSKVNESKSSTEIAAFNNKEASLKIWVEAGEKERLKVSEELRETKGRERTLRDEMTQVRKKVEASMGEITGLSQHSSRLETDLKLSKEKYFQIKKTNDELFLNKDEMERSQESTSGELTRLKDNCEELSEKNGKLSADLKAYKRIVVEKESQLKKVEQELAQLHKTKDMDLKELLKKDREIAFMKARVSSTERGASAGSMRRGGGTNASLNLTGGVSMNESGSKDVEIYLERIVELESECKAQNLQIDEFQKHQYHAKKDAQRSDSLKQELAGQDEELQRLRRELSRSKQDVDDLRDREEQLRIIVDEKEHLRQEVVRLQSKVNEVSELKQVCEQKEEEMRALRRMSSEEIDLEGKVTRLKDRCREKDEEIEELHQKVISLQVKMKDFMQENSQVEEQMRSVKDKYSIELGEKEKFSQALKTAETKCRSLEGDLEQNKSLNESQERELVQTRRHVETIGTEKQELDQKIEELIRANKSKEEEVEELRKEVESLKNAKIENVEGNEDIPDGASTPLNNSLESPRLTFSRNDRTSAYDRLESLEEENIQLLNKQSELEEELDVAEEHANELKNTLKVKRETVNELHAELDGVKERLKSVEKGRDEMMEENEQLQRDYLLTQQKIEDLKAANDRYVDESDELDKALAAAERRIDELEKKLDEVSGKCANSEGQLQSVTERLARRERELEVVETHVDEQRKLCDGYKASAEKQETLVEKLRVEKVSTEETFLALKLEVAKKEGSYKTGKEKIAEFQTRLYETEDKLSRTANECKKLSRDNERLKREVNELENKLSEKQSFMMNKRITSDTEKFISLNTSVKGNSQNVEGLDTKLNSAQSKISTLEVELANDLRKFSLHRSTSDVSRRGYSEGNNQLGIGSYGRRSRSHSTDGRESLRSVSPLPRAGSVVSFDGEDENNRETRFGELDLDFNIPSVEIHQVEVTPRDKTGISENTGNGQDEDSFLRSEDGLQSSGVDVALSQADPFFTRGSDGSSAATDGFSEHIEERLTNEISETLFNEASSIFRSTDAPLESQPVEFEEPVEPVEPVEPEVEIHIPEVITSQTAVVTGNFVNTSLPGNWNEEELIYF